MSDFEKICAHTQSNVKLTIPVGIKLRPCLFCGSDKIIIEGRKAIYGHEGVWVRCVHCGACGPSEAIHQVIECGDTLYTPVTRESVEKGKHEAIVSWNLIAARKNVMSIRRLQYE